MAADLAQYPMTPDAETLMRDVHATRSLPLGSMEQASRHTNGEQVGVYVSTVLRNELGMDAQRELNMHLQVSVCV